MQGNVIDWFFRENLNFFIQKFFFVLGSSSKNKKSVLYDKTFLIDIDDNIVSSKVEKLVNTYGGVSL